MRIVHDPQARLGLAGIADLVFDPKSRESIKIRGRSGGFLEL